MRVALRLSMSATIIAASAWALTPPRDTPASTAQSMQAMSQGHVVRTGSVDLRSLATSTAVRQAPTTVHRHELPNGAARKSASPAVSVPVPNPAVTSVVTGSGGSQGFAGISDLTQLEASNANQYTLEPPDQGLCAHNGVIVETVNNGLQVYTEAGQALTPVIGMNAFFHLPPEINFAYNPPIFGPFVSDPRCYYDSATRRWFVSELEIDINPYSGSFGYRSAELFAVSQSSDPLGGWGLFMIDSTNDGNDGTPSDANCPCFGDQPRIGADANGFFIATDIYPIHGTFNSDGGEVFAVSKAGIVGAAVGGPLPTLVEVHNGAVIVDGYPANALQPAESPEGGAYAPDTEYFLNTPDYNGFATMGGAGEHALEIWKLTGTSTLSAANPALTLTWAEIPSENFAPPVAATQKPGPTPFGSSVGATEAQLSVNDDRMQQVEYVGGKLYTTLNTGVGPGGVANRSAVAWFQVTPSGSSGSVTAQGYVAAAGGTSLLYPSIGLGASGEGVMTFSVSGPGNWPSAAFMTFDDASGPSSPITINGAGAHPEDGFTCYAQSGFGPTCRWGDYTAASADGTGRIVFAAEMIPNSARPVDSNWGTFVSSIVVP